MDKLILSAKGQRGILATNTNLSITQRWELVTNTNSPQSKQLKPIKNPAYAGFLKLRFNLNYIFPPEQALHIPL